MADFPRIRLYVPADYAPGADLDLSPEQAHYLHGVMRRKPGDRLGAFNGRQGEWRAEITRISRKSATLRLDQPIRPQATLPDLWLCFAPIKKARIDYLAQKATEMGAGALQPVITARTEARRVNVGRLSANVIEAAEQCTLTALPEVREPLSLEALLADWDPARHLMFCDESASSGRSAAGVLGALERGGKWAILTGPEGGFTADEAAAIAALPSAVPVSLGPRIMRADTAIVAAMAVWQSILGDWQD